MVKKKYWTEQEIYNLVIMRKKGISYKEISKKLNRTISSLQTQMHNIKYKVDRISEEIRKVQNGRTK